MKRLVIIFSILLVFMLIGLYIYSKDNYRFKLSYEMMNKIEDSNGKTIKVSIPTKNRVKYINNKELLDILKNKTGIIYFGYNTCPWCRNAIPILIDSIISNDIDNLYYVDIHKVKLSNEVIKILEPYLKEKDGNKVLAVPDVYVVKKGKILSEHRGTVESYKNPYKGMNKEQKKELKDIYDSMIKEIK